MPTCAICGSENPAGKNPAANVNAHPARDTRLSGAPARLYYLDSLGRAGAGALRPRSEKPQPQPVPCPCPFLWYPVATRLRVFDPLASTLRMPAVDSCHPTGYTRM
jgi:hypothetical protein